ncbi:MAG TPA: iron-sulfur cluster-binding domain-containing protein [Ferruginibacter sp.]|nr:iron-sulfur cluster-binding domain-containing protein [Ferruginibacter sp.]HRO17638.1 iron-sulfur cluster-binding domain-containing protein [Ferruginibacter sp.]HRQ20464.1 iron-sulfur cluster-binding domain-containing protein [Ferruginibacter sp.]
MYEHTYTSLEVIHVIRETPSAVSLVLKPLNGKLVHYLPGQFITLVFQTSFGPKKRSYSISSSPALNEPLTITVKRVENGEFSRQLTEQTRTGDILYMEEAGGRFVLPENPAQYEYLFLAAGSGITPVYSLVKTLLHTTQTTIHLMYSNTGIAETIFLKHLKALAFEYPDRFRLRFFFSSDENILERRLSSHLLNRILKEQFASVKMNLQVYMCGPFLYMDTAGIILRSFGVPAHQIHTEDFHPLPLEELPKPPDLRAHPVTLLLNGKSVTLEVQYPQSISKAAQEAGLPVPFSCESGQCGSCMAKLIEGEIWMAYNEVLTDREITDGLRLTCLGFPINGPVTIQF